MRLRRSGVSGATRSLRSRSRLPRARPPDALAQLRRQLNAFARLEINLWSFAADGGYDEPPPYLVRYDLARWLWHPSIAGSIFCLRCGDELRYVRSQRTASGGVRHDSRTARYRACARGAEDDWPAHALEPYGRGAWLLECQFSGCTELFVGRRNAHYCGRHRASRRARDSGQKGGDARLARDQSAIATCAALGDASTRSLSHVLPARRMCT